MKLFLIACYSLFALFQSPVAQPAGFDVTKLSKNGQEAYRIVRDTDVFALGRVGFAGTTSVVEDAVRTLTTEEYGDEALADLTERATPEGKLMALHGLRFADQAAFSEKLALLRSLPEPTARGEGDQKIDTGYVVVMRGCFVSRERWADVLDGVGSSSYPGSGGGKTNETGRRP